MSPGADKPRSVMDPQAMALAEMYAQALLDLTDSDEQAEEVFGELQAVMDLADRVEGFADLIEDPTIRPEARQEMIARIFGGRISRRTEGFLAVLARRGRMGLLRQAAGAFRRLLNVREGKVEVVVTTAAPLEPAQREQVAKALREALQAEPILRPRVDESLLGGLVLRVGDRVFDASLAGQLRRLRDRMLGRRFGLGEVPGKEGPASA